MLNRCLVKGVNNGMINFSEIILIVNVSGKLIMKIESCGVMWLSIFNVMFRVSNRVISGNVSISLFIKINELVWVNVRKLLLLSGLNWIGKV